MRISIHAANNRAVLGDENAEQKTSIEKQFTLVRDADKISGRKSFGISHWAQGRSNSLLQISYICETFTFLYGFCARLTSGRSDTSTFFDYDWWRSIAI